MTNFRCRINGQLGGTLPWSCGVIMAGTLSEAALLAQFSTAVTNLWTTATNGLQNFMTSDVTVTGVSVATLDPSTFHELTKTTGTLSIPGTATGNSLPWDTAEVIGLGSTGLQRYQRGRMKLPPFATNQIASHVIIPTTTAKMKIVLDAFFPAARAGMTGYIVFNQKTTKQGIPPHTVENLSTYHISDKPASQARRVSKVVPTFTVGSL